MVKIDGIRSFLNLREDQQSDILRGLKMKERLFTFLENRQTKEVKERHTVSCRGCSGTGKVMLTFMLARFTCVLESCGLI